MKKKFSLLGLLLAALAVFATATPDKKVETHKSLHAKMICCATFGGCHTAATTPPQLILTMDKSPASAINGTIVVKKESSKVEKEHLAGDDVGWSIANQYVSSSGGGSNDKVPDDVGWRSAMLSNKAIIVGT